MATGERNIFVLKSGACFQTVFIEKSQYLLTRLLHVFFLGFALEEMFVYWQWSWTRLLLKSRAEVGVVSLSRAGHPACCYLCSYCKAPQGGLFALCFHGRKQLVHDASYSLRCLHRCVETGFEDLCVVERSVQDCSGGVI